MKHVHESVSHPHRPQKHRAVEFWYAIKPRFTQNLCKLCLDCGWQTCTYLPVNISSDESWSEKSNSLLLENYTCQTCVCLVDWQLTNICWIWSFTNNCLSLQKHTNIAFLEQKQRCLLWQSCVRPEKRFLQFCNCIFFRHTRVWLYRTVQTLVWN